MARYGYTMDGNDYSDIGTHLVRCECFRCGRRQFEQREATWLGPNDKFLTDDMCSEFGDGRIDHRQHEW